MIRTYLLHAVALTVLTASATVASGAGPSKSITAAVADPARPEADRARDADRKPAELVAFADIKPGMSVAELAPGGGYFTRILASTVGPKGHVYAMVGRPSPALSDYASTHPNLSVVSAKSGEINVPTPVDVVWTTLNYHDFKNAKVGESDVAALTNAAAFKALKRGGIYLVVDHQAAPGSGTSATSTLHRVEAAAVKKEVEAAGFKLAGESNLLHHTADDHTLRVQESGIRGRTDQFVLKFRKP